MVMALTQILRANRWGLVISVGSRPTELRLDRRSEIWNSRGQSAEEPEAAGQHHVAMRDREVRSQSRAREQGAPRTGHGEQLRRDRRRAALQSAVAHIVEDLLVRYRTGRQSFEIAL